MIKNEVPEYVDKDVVEAVKKYVHKINSEAQQKAVSGAYSASQVVHPKHYMSDGGVECFDILVDTLGKDGFEAFCVGNMIKYLVRYKRKGGVQDVKKVEMYAHTMIQEMEKNAKKM